MSLVSDGRTAAEGSARDGLSILDQAISQAAGKKVSENAVRDMLGLADRALVFDLFDAVMSGDVKKALDLLAERRIPHRAYWIANMIRVRGDRRLVEELAEREDVFHIYANPRVRLDGPVASSPAGPFPSSPDAIEWGVNKVRAPQAWALGFTGEGIVVGGQDTGYAWEHPAIENKYRGWNGSAADEGIGNRVRSPAVLSRPISFRPVSVNHRWPSGPKARPHGSPRPPLRAGTKASRNAPVRPSYRRMLWLNQLLT